MSLVPSLLDALFGDEETIFECRNCGTTLDDPTETCPDCGAEEAIRYQIK